VSAENVDLIVRGYAYHAETGDLLVAALHEDIEWHTAADLPDSDTYRGFEAVRGFLNAWGSAFEDFRGEILEVLDEGDYVVASLIVRGRLRDSGDEVAMPEVHVWKMRDGKAVEVREYRTKEAALEAIRAAAGPQT
jgi:uncharacterized protein